MNVKRLGYDDRTYEFLTSYKSMGAASIRYFVPATSDHTTINLWRKLRGKNALKAWRGEYAEEHDVESYLGYLLTDKELFQAKLLGYFDTEDSELALRGFQDPWMKSKAKVLR